MLGGMEGSGEFVEALEATSRGIRDPVAKLRFIRTSLSRYQTIDLWLRRVPWAPARRTLYRWLSLERLQHLLTETPFGAPVPMDPRVRRGLLAARIAVAVVALAVSGAALFAVYRVTRQEAAPLHAAAPAPVTSAPSALPRPDAPASAPARGIAPAAVWLVEQGSGFEQYSNGLRIDTSLATEGTPREYRVFAASGLSADLHHRPAGILFHTTESDVWPLEASFNENLRDTSQKLLRYVQRNRLYHYVIDRFGRVYRIVDEGAKANHAGHSVWADGPRIYLNLNHAFLGVSFETRWEGGRALPITQAQFSAGRSLADHLRQKWDIPAAMCVTHGLTSVNPKKHLIGHHVDWARGFPFEAYGLPDQYLRPPPSVALFGFGYDGDLIKVMGEPWPGVRDAERALGIEAVRLGKSLEALRAEKQGLYDRWVAEQVHDESTRAAAAPAGAAAPRS